MFFINSIHFTSSCSFIERSPRLIGAMKRSLAHPFFFRVGETLAFLLFALPLKSNKVFCVSRLQFIRFNLKHVSLFLRQAQPTYRRKAYYCKFFVLVTSIFDKSI